MAASQFQYLFSRYRLRNLVLRNRVVSTPHTARLVDDGMPGDRYTAYVARKG